jgi:outer membrane protein OmpA-like peptidoglycan-associated protein
MRQDSVSAEETRRLRAVAAQYQMLRDSVNRAPRAMPPAPTPTPAVSSTAALATMEQVVYFGRDESTLSDSAKMILDEKVVVFKANPNMKIVVVGNASQPGTAPYNMALGLRRAEASKAYLVSKGVDAGRIEIATKGEGQLAVDGDDMAANAANRRSQFRLLVADPFLRRP